MTHVFTIVDYRRNIRFLQGLDAGDVCALICLCHLYSKYTLRDVVDFRTFKITIHLSIIQPYSDYCAQIWGCLGQGLSDNIVYCILINKKWHEFLHIF